MEGLKAISQSAKATFLRFPGVMLAAALATGIAISWVFLAKVPRTDLFFLQTARFFLMGLLGIPWLYSLTVWVERRFQGGARFWLPLILGFAVLALYYFRTTFVPLAEIPPDFIIEVAALWFALHFFAAYAPYIGFEEPRGFWEYNRSVFLRFLLALVFSGTLWIGVGILFGIFSSLVTTDLSKGYGVIAIFILGIFNTWFFLAGVPDDWEALEKRPRPYPRALKFFLQFILVPLILLIGLGLELLFLKEWAGGRKPYYESVAPGFVLLGGFALLTYLLLFPLEEEDRLSWLRAYRVGFFLALLVPLGWLVYSTITEVKKAGWTQPLYYLLILTLWGLGVSIYLILARRVRIQWIPLSLSLIAGLSAVPPVGASSVARRSQERRLDSLFDTFGLAKGSPDLKKIAGLSAEAKNDISAKKNFLEENFGCAALKPYFGPGTNPSPEETLSHCGFRNLELALIPDAGPSIVPGETVALRLNFNLTQPGNYQGISVQGFDFYFPDSKIDFVESAAAAEMQGSPCASGVPPPSLCAVFEKGGAGVELYLDRESLGRLDLSPTFQALRAKHGNSIDPNKKTDTDAYFDLPAAEMSFDYTVKAHRLRLVFSNLHLNQKGDRLEGGYVRFSALVKR